MNTIKTPKTFNYIGCFLTFGCPYRCSYCINHFGESHLGYKMVSGKEWVKFFRRLDTNVPITLQGGEPGIHPDFIHIVRETLEFHPVDILTTLAFDIDRFIAEINPEKINRSAPYAPIRVSYHPEQFSLSYIIDQVLRLQNAGFRIGLYGVEHPDQIGLNHDAQRICKHEGIDFRTKPFLGWHEGVLYGEYSEPDGLAGRSVARCDCAPSELLIAPDGTIHRCHYYVYNHGKPLGHISDKNLQQTEEYLPCSHFGQCNPCDLKVKNNRFQQFGHVSAKIRDIQHYQHETEILPC